MSVSEKALDPTPSWRLVANAEDDEQWIVYKEPGTGDSLEFWPDQDGISISVGAGPNEASVEIAWHDLEQLENALRWLRWWRTDRLSREGGGS